MQELTDWADRAQQQWKTTSWTWHYVGIMLMLVAGVLLILASVYLYRKCWRRTEMEQEEMQMEA
jgi:hypothetical protein